MLARTHRAVEQGAYKGGGDSQGDLPFSHMGGVSKTTTTVHLRLKLERLGHRVLILDADPHCNLIGLTLESAFARLVVYERSSVSLTS
ncbi:AAA family ATPase [Sphingomonas bacterium]|uniref:nucleotide-binding protein n=1 Tax=Sphingomonas bacterium TaxID=1895847 RepID=UPI001575D641